MRKMRKIKIEICIICLLMIFVLSSCASFYLDSIKYRIDADYGEDYNTNELSLIDGHVFWDGKRWTVITGFEFTWINSKQNQLKSKTKEEK